MSKSPRGGQRTHSIRERLTVDRKQRFASMRRHSHVTCGRVVWGGNSLPLCRAHLESHTVACSVLGPALGVVSLSSKKTNL